jgi:Tfp pilus assembly protein PilE
MFEQVISRVRGLLLGLLVAVVLAGWTPLWAQHFVQQHLHRIQIELLRAAELEHQYFQEKGHYASKAQLQQRFPDWQAQTADAVLSLQHVDRNTFVILALSKQTQSEPTCQRITLNHAGRWCASGECDSDCWQFK